MEPECPHNHIIELLRAVLPYLLEITRFFFLGKDPRASEAKRWARKQHSAHGSQKPFHVTLYAELKLLFDVAITFTEPRQKLRGAIFEETRVFLEGLGEDFINLPVSETAAHSSVSRHICRASSYTDICCSLMPAAPDCQCLPACMKVPKEFQTTRRGWSGSLDEHCSTDQNAVLRSASSNMPVDLERSSRLSKAAKLGPSVMSPRKTSEKSTEP